MVVIAISLGGIDFTAQIRELRAGSGVTRERQVRIVVEESVTPLAGALHQAETTEPLRRR
jgi:hypothetical protein